MSVAVEQRARCGAERARNSVNDDCACVDTHSCVQSTPHEPPKKRVRTMIDCNVRHDKDVDDCGAAFVLAEYDAPLALETEAAATFSLRELYAVLSGRSPLWRPSRRRRLRCLCRACEHCERRQQAERLELSILTLRVNKLLPSTRARNAVRRALLGCAHYVRTSLPYARGCVTLPAACNDGTIDVPDVSPRVPLTSFLYFLCIRTDRAERGVADSTFINFAKNYTLRSCCNSANCVRPQHYQCLLKKQVTLPTFVFVQSSVDSMHDPRPSLERCGACARLCNDWDNPNDSCRCENRFLRPTYSLFDRITVEALLEADEYLAEHHEKLFGEPLKLKL